ncbi:MAG: 4-hydroxybenzoate 3-monooxygenase [Micrococcales bacterium 73-13]|nr:MAG: 4-hydroxybenzoate 3-monooxygenase [Micrococcales bacterium 73-13]
MTEQIRTRVAIVGAGPAGLALSALLHRSGIDSIVIDPRTREDIERTIKAGILEQSSVELLRSLGGSRVDEVGARHDGIELRWNGVGHRIDFQGLVGRSVWLYPQHEALIDLIALRLGEGGDVRFGVGATSVEGVDTDAPVVHAAGPDGRPIEIRADVVVGADGSRSLVREAVTGSQTGGYFREYPFAWFGILCEAPPSSPELIYSTTERGFALISQRSATVQRMYLQCDPELDPDAMGEREIWDELQARTGGGLHEGPIFQRDVLRFRSFVAHELRRGRALLVGDAAHTVPPTGAKGMNLALADVVLLHRAIEELVRSGSEHGLDAYPEAASRRIWKAEHFSWWMTSMLHTAPGANDFDERRRLGELEMVATSRHGAAYLAEAYTGWPFETRPRG